MEDKESHEYRSFQKASSHLEMVLKRRRKLHKEKRTKGASTSRDKVKSFDFSEPEVAALSKPSRFKPRKDNDENENSGPKTNPTPNPKTNSSFNFKNITALKIERSLETNTFSPLINSKYKKQQDVIDMTVESNLQEYQDKESEMQFLKNLKFMDPYKIIKFVNAQTIGRSLMIPTPFGQKLKLYCDYTASGQEVKFILDEIMKVEEMYANTHTESCYTGIYMNHLLHQAEATILKQFKASPENYFIVEGGSGSTYGIEASQKILGTYIPPKFKQHLSNAGEDFDQIKTSLREKGMLPLVVVTTYEHHSNEITWRKQLCDVTEIGFAEDGYLDLKELEETLKQNYGKRTMIASLSAGSNVTGIKTDVEAAARICKQYGTPAFFDYAAVGPYIPIDLSKRTSEGGVLIDGIYLSPHKFLGGPGACGLLVMNKRLYDTKLAPTHGGGGTVTFVGPKGEDYNEDISSREKSGTPGIIQIIKCALALELKGMLQPLITEREHRYNTIFFERMSKHKNFMILGPKDPETRVGIFSFLIRMDGPQGKRFLHYLLVAHLLNDIFGIQSRGGCFCAAIYNNYLMKIDNDTAEEIRAIVVKSEDAKVFENAARPGSTRISIHYSMSLEELEYVMFALEYICDHGPKFLPLYTFESSGEWTHKTQESVLPTFGLGCILGQQAIYAKDEASRNSLFEKQKEDAIKLLETLPESKGYDPISELGKYFNYYVEKGNITDRHLLENKIAVLQKNENIHL